MVQRGFCRVFLSVTQASAILAVSASGALAEVKPIEMPLSENVELTFYGQINQGVLVYDDGGDDNSIFVPVDNSISSSRFGARIDSKLGGGWAFRGNLEFEYTPSPSKSVNQVSDVTNWDFDKNNLRKAEIYFKNDTYGTIWLGQGSMATDGIAEIDQSGTELVAESDFFSVGGGFFYRLSGVENIPDTGKDEGLSTVTVGKTFSNFDGSRRLRLRYDTPVFGQSGINVSVAYGEEVIKDNDDNTYYDAALRYSGKFSGFEAKAGFGYSNLDNDTDVWSGSASIIHTETGVNLTVAIGEQDSAGTTSNSGFIKLGLLRKFFPQGTTALSIDYGKAQEVRAQDTSAKSWGLSVVQKFDEQNLEVYGTVRNYSYDDYKKSYEDGLAVFAGARFKF